MTSIAAAILTLERATLKQLNQCRVIVVGHTVAVLYQCKRLAIWIESPQST